MITKYGTHSPRRSWHPFGKILASVVLKVLTFKSTIWEERPPLKIFASCLVLGVNFEI